MFFVYFFEEKKWNRYYITRLVIGEAKIEITYWDKEKEKTETYPIDKTEIKIGYIWYKVKPPVPYLKLKFNDLMTLWQHEYAEWDLKRFEEVMSTLKSVKSIQP